MGRPTLEQAHVFLQHGPAWRAAQRGHLSQDQLKVMSAIAQCRGAALGGHMLRCEGSCTDQVLQLLQDPALPQVPERSGAAPARCRQADLLPVEYRHSLNACKGQPIGMAAPYVTIEPGKR